MNWQEFWDTLFGGGRYKKLYLDTLDSLRGLNGQLLTCLKRKHKVEQENERLRLLVPHPPPPEIDYIIEKDTIWVQQVLLEMGANLIRIPLDAKYRLTDVDTFLDIVAWDWIDKRKYQAEVYDCENFAISFKAHVDEFFGLNQVGIVIDYRAGHGYNLVIFPGGKVMLLEPQADNLFCWAEDDAVMYILKEAIVLI